jgi:holliday junction DNA helicase RuvA
MYEFVAGELVEVSPAHAVVQSHGVGFILHISLHTYSEIKELSTVKLYTHQVIREDAHMLYGFATADEREVFRHLISVSGIGPNTARMILSSVNEGEVVAAIQQGDAIVFQRIKGIGAKSAQRIIIDLKDKVGKMWKGTDISVTRHNTHQQEALSALVLLGFNKAQAAKAVEKFGMELGPGAAVETLIKECLKIL